MATLSLKNIDKIYDNNVQAVFDFNLDIVLYLKLLQQHELFDQ